MYAICYAKYAKLSVILVWLAIIYGAYLNLKAQLLEKAGVLFYAQTSLNSAVGDRRGVRVYISKGL